jgi:hypothetical protein
MKIKITIFFCLLLTASLCPVSFLGQGAPSKPTTIQKSPVLTQKSQIPPGTLQVASADQDLTSHGCKYFLGRKSQYLCQTEAGYNSCLAYLKQGLAQYCAWADHPDSVVTPKKLAADQDLTGHGCKHFLGRKGQYLCETEDGYHSCLVYLKQGLTSYCAWGNHPDTATKAATPQDAAASLKFYTCTLNSEGVWTCPTNAGYNTCQAYKNGGAVKGCAKGGLTPQELAAMQAIASALHHRVPLYRLIAPNTSLHFYTIDEAEKNALIKYKGFELEGVTGWVYPKPEPGTVPLYRLVLNIPNIGTDHFYTIHADQKNGAITQFGFIDEGIACYVSLAQAAGTLPLYRLYKPDPPSNDSGEFTAYIPGSHDHFYTASEDEKFSAMFQFGYNSEGNEGYVWTKSN